MEWTNLLGGPTRSSRSCARNSYLKKRATTVSRLKQNRRDLDHIVPSITRALERALFQQSRSRDQHFAQGPTENFVSSLIDRTTDPSLQMDLYAQPWGLQYLITAGIFPIMVPMEALPFTILYTRGPHYRTTVWPRASCGKA